MWMSAMVRLCCKSLLALLIKNSLGSRCDFGIDMSGTSSHSDELTGDFGNKPEAILIGDHVLSCLLTGKLSLRDLRLLQQYRHLADILGAATFCPLSDNSGQRWILVRDGLSANDPYATSGKPLLDRLGGNSEHARWNGEAERFCGHGAVRPIASRSPRRLLSSKLLQSSSGECRLNSAVLRARRIA